MWHIYPSDFNMARWKLTFEYDGTHFSGWQKQPSGRTVEGEVESAFSTLYQQKIDVIGQGRTDAGVHARGQVAHVDLPDRFTSQRLIHAMRGLLPKDVALLQADQTYPDFHARFNAIERSYSYSVMQRHSPLQRNRVWNCLYELDFSRLQKMAELILETRDFVNFCIPDENSFTTTESEISVSEWTYDDEIYTYKITGNRFLRHMVRRLVGSMIHVATEKLTRQQFYDLLNGEPVQKKGHAAPSHGLFLEAVSYEPAKTKEE